MSVPEVAPISDEVLARLPIFPLPNVVLFPGALLPLHVFEPRYRDLVRHCLDHDRCMAVPLLKPGYSSEAYLGSPPIFEVMGAGRVVGHQALPDGRWNILIQGTDRVGLDEEWHTDHSFRMLRAHRLVSSGEISQQASQTLSRLTLQLARMMPQARDALTRLAAEVRTPAELADQLSAYLVGDLETRQGILEALDLQARVDRVIDALGGLLLKLSEAPDDGALN